MNDEKKSELRIDGFGTSSGGQFFQVNINGRGKISNDLHCTRFSCNGITHIDGSLHAEHTDVNGFLTTERDITSDELAVYGRTNVYGSVLANDMRVEGDVSVSGDCQANDFYCRGRIHVNGILQADEINMTIYGMSRFRNMNAKTIQVKRGLKDVHFITKVISPLPKVRVDEIIGEDIYLEYTQAGTVRGKSISLGPGCVIDSIEYEETFHQDSDSEVHSTKKLL